MTKVILTSTLTAVLFFIMPALVTVTNAADKSSQVKEAAPNVAEFDKQMAQVQETMKKMQEQMDGIQQAEDPKARQKLLQDHWATMQKGMGMMHDMWGPGMMGCCTDGSMMDGNMMGGGHMMGGMMGGPMMGWGRMGDYYSKLTPEQMKQRQYMTDQYTGMQQMMMDHMMQHQQYMWMR